MRILIANKFYYPRGGDCIYTIELEKLLKKNGHDVAIFSQNHPNNYKNQYSNYWPSEVNYSSINITNIRESLIRPVFSKEINNKYNELINYFKPDVVHLNNIHTQLSPLIAEISYNNDIPVVWTLHDFKILCPANYCMRNGEICELCFTNKVNVIKYRCVKNIVGSIIAYIEALKWNLDNIKEFTSYFITPSAFMKQKMIQGGLLPSKIKLLNNFLDNSKITKDTKIKGNYYLYVGRMSEEKGLQTLLEASSHLPYNIKLVGAGPLLNKLIAKYKNNNIEFLGYKDWDELNILIQKAKFVVIPSECYENNPLTIIESFALGTPVIGSNIGGIPEMIINNETGLLFHPGDVADLTKKIVHLFNNPTLLDVMQKFILDKYLSNYTSSFHYNNLYKIYQNAIKYVYSS